MTTFIKAKIKKSADKYRVTANITEYQNGRANFLDRINKEFLHST